MCTICAQLMPFGPEFHYERAEILETSDADSTISTSYSMLPGDTFSGMLTTSDVDVIELSVSIGETFTLETYAGAGDSVQDTYLTLLNSSGTVIAANDDGGTGFFSSLTYTATEETYYIRVNTYQTQFGFNSSDTGTYVLEVSTGGSGGGSGGSGGSGDDLQTFSVSQIANQLTDGYWESTGRTVNGFNISVANGASATITVNTDDLTAEGRWFAELAMDAWEAVTGITFQSTGGSAQITFIDNNSGAYASTTTNFWGDVISSTINVSQSWISGDHYDIDSYSLQTYIHEIGHALGLGHGGNYNAGSGGPITYTNNAEYTNDSWQMSVMSYFSQTENTSINATYAFTLTPMMADIFGVQQTYGTSGTLRTGDTTYGVGSNTGDFYDYVSANFTNMAFTLLDDGGIDTVNFSSTAANQTIDLNEGAFSSVGGEVGNMGIALGTVIENAVTGAGNDVITGNSADNDLKGNDGNDTLTGNGGSDRLRGNDGDDTLDGGDGDDFLFGGKDADTITGGDGDDRLRGNGAGDTLDGGDGNDNIRGGGGSDIIIGGDGDDTLNGENGTDTITGGAGDDNLVGGANRDTFIFAEGDGRDKLRDFEDGLDVMDVSAFGFADFTEIQSRAFQSNGDTIIELSSTTTIVMKDFLLINLSADDFIL